VPGQFGTFNGTDSPLDPRNRKADYALSDLDQRHRFVANTNGGLLLVRRATDRRCGEQLGTALSSARFPGAVRNAFTGPSFQNVDLRIGREFRLTERMKLAFIGEAFNLFNFTNILKCEQHSR
jgi:hypothetical protein